MRSILVAASTVALFAGAALSGEVSEHLGEDPTGDLEAGISESSDPTRVVEELVDDPVRDDDGLLQAESGGAEPKENWMGCDITTARVDDACQDPAGVDG